MDPRQVEDLIRHFPENGIKWLLHHPANVRETLQMSVRDRPGFPDLARFDFDRMTVEPTSFIHDDFRHGLTDLLVRIPFRLNEAESRTIGVYFLFEHLSQHQRPIVARVLSYVMDAYREQERAWLRKHESTRDMILSPVLPVIFHTGLHAWRDLTPMADLVAGGDAFGDLIPAFQPIFLSLPTQHDADFDHAGSLGHVLRLLQQRDVDLVAFRKLVAKAVRELEQQLLPQDRNRLMDLLRYIVAMVYHYRERAERTEMREVIQHSLRTAPFQREVKAMGQTIAESLREEGKIEGKLEGHIESRQEILMLQLQKKFGKQVTNRMIKKIQSTHDLERLTAWMSNFANADTLDDVGLFD